MYGHENSKNPFLFNKIQKIQSLGYKIIYQKWFESEDEDFCYWMEIYLIAEYGRLSNKTGILCNLIDGGDGGAINFGPWSEELKARIRGKGNPFYGKKHPEGKFKGRISPLKGKKMSPEHLAKTRRTGSSLSKETRAKISAFQKGRKKSEEHKAKIRISVKATKARKAIKLDNYLLL
jgi:hypothetical protein